MKDMNQEIMKRIARLEHQVAVLTSRLNGVIETTTVNPELEDTYIIQDHQGVIDTVNGEALIWTDGSCEHGKHGGWGYVIRCGSDIYEGSGAELVSTNNRMELMAAIMAIERLPVGLETFATVYSDSRYVVDGINSWIHKWKQNKWSLSPKGTTLVKNKELWERLDAARECRTIQFKWIRGHAGNTGNMRADQLASEAARSVVQ